MLVELWSFNIYIEEVKSSNPNIRSLKMLLLVFRKITISILYLKDDNTLNSFISVLNRNYKTNLAKHPNPKQVKRMKTAGLEKDVFNPCSMCLVI